MIGDNDDVAPWSDGPACLVDGPVGVSPCSVGAAAVGFGWQTFPDLVTEQQTLRFAVCVHEHQMEYELIVVLSIVMVVHQHSSTTFDG